MQEPFDCRRQKVSNFSGARFICAYIKAFDSVCIVIMKLVQCLKDYIGLRHIGWPSGSHEKHKHTNPTANIVPTIVWKWTRADFFLRFTFQTTFFWYPKQFPDIKNKFDCCLRFFVVLEIAFLFRLSIVWCYLYCIKLFSHLF